MAKCLMLVIHLTYVTTKNVSVGYQGFSPFWDTKFSLSRFSGVTDNRKILQVEFNCLLSLHVPFILSRVKTPKQSQDLAFE